MKKKKKRMSNRKFLILWVPFLVLATSAAITLETIIPGYATMLDTFAGRIYSPLGKGDIVKTPAKGTEGWNRRYYHQSFKTGNKGEGSLEAKLHAEKLVQEIAAEGMVLLKNDKDALPLKTKENKKIALFGRGSADPVYGGSGSGNVDTSNCITPYLGLKNAGFEVNEEIYQYFAKEAKNYPRQEIKMDDYEGSTFLIGEINPEYYPNSFQSRKEETALVFLSRCGGEGLDLSRDLKKDSKNKATQAIVNRKDEIGENAKKEIEHYQDNQHELQLSQEEKEMLEFTKKNFKQTIVVLNLSTTMEVHDLKNDEKIAGIIWAGSPGSTGFNALGKILSGEVNPSGKTPDIYASSFRDDPTFQNFATEGEHQYKDVKDIDAGRGKEAHFLHYEEGIYLGYRYYETRAKEDKDFKYLDAVTYPFGYGLSYTSFEKKIESSSSNEEEIKLSVSVKNVGQVAGKEAVQIYCSAPFTRGGIEKPHTVLVEFGKTKLLKPQESETLGFKIKTEDLASYDYNDKNKNGFKGYELEGGEYKITVKENSHDVSMDADNKALEFSVNLKARQIRRKTSDKNDVINQFDDVSAIFKKDQSGYAHLMSRADFKGSFPSSPTKEDTVASRIMVNGKSVLERLKPYKIENNELDKMPKMNAKNGLSIIDVRGLDYEDEKYEKLLDQLSEFDYAKSSQYLVNGAYNTPKMEHFGKPYTEDHDGPQGFSSLFGNKYKNFTAYMSEPILAATFNKELAKMMGTSIGEEALASNPIFSVWYGPGMNTHRSPFAGRNFEYYSEDGLLAGKIAANVISGAASKGLYAYIKHFALNGQETWRVSSLCTWVDEQAIREIYLKPFEIVVKEASTEVDFIKDNKGNHAKKKMNAATAVMSSFNRIGTTWAGGYKNLLTNVLREEWGFRGFVLSDFNLFDYMNCDQGVRAGTDMQLTWLKKMAMPIGKIGDGFLDTSSATARLALRKAYHNVFYTIANSNAMQDVASGTTISYKASGWRVLLSVVTGTLASFAIAGTIWVLYRSLHYKKNEEVKDNPQQ